MEKESVHFAADGIIGAQCEFVDSNPWILYEAEDLFIRRNIRLCAKRRGRESGGIR